ncbi:DUF2187 family protein [Neobacillus dielmonensis]|uniref:DUF2187 family protein n=1 Tax=Neobacillus dielmonensis TaxID=1347369 RepID=UPI0005AAFE97|nr:DUF2187 family protein [Neobacillus dielmonensis]
MKIAEVNDQIRSNKGIVGIVEKVYENSVMIKILENPTDISFENNVTVINHKNYKVIQPVAFQQNS